MSEYKISLGVDVDVSDIQSQINTKAKDVSIPIKLEVENIGDIKKQIQGLGILKGGIEIPLSIDTSTTIKSAQQVGQKIGNTVTKEVKKAIDIDDVIDQEVLNLMKTFSIAGDKGSSAFKEIKQALIECRSELQKLKNSDLGIDAELFDTSRAFDKVTDAVANQMRAVNNLGDEYIALAKYMKSFNDPKKGNKVRVPDFIKQEQGDDYKSSRGTLGIAFNTEKGISFASFLEDLNHELGISIDLTKGEEKAYEELVHKIRLGREQLEAQKKSQTSLQANASTEEILSQNFINRNEIRDVAESSIDYINATEAASSALVQSSTQAANTVIQNEERIQQAKRETTKEFLAVQKGGFQRAFSPADKELGGINNTAKSVEEYFKGVNGVLADTVSVQERFDADKNLTGFTVSLKNANGAAEQLRYTLRTIEDTDISFFEYTGGSINDNGVLKQMNAISTKADTLQNKLNKLKSSYLDQNVQRPIKDDSHIAALSEQYDKVEKAIIDVRNADEATFASMVSNAQREITALETMVSEFRNAENVSSKMKGTDFASGLDIAKNDLEKFKAQAKDFPQITATIEELDNAIKGIGDAASLNKFNDQLRVARSELAKIKAETIATNRKEKVGIDVSGATSRIANLQRISPEIDKFKADINGAEVTVESLLNDLSRVSTADDFSVVNKRLNSFEKAAESAGIAVKELSRSSSNTSFTKEINQDLDNFIKLQKQIENTRFEIGKLEITGDSTNQIAELKRQLEELENTYDKLMQAFLKKVSVNADIVPQDALSKLDNGITEATTNANNRLEQFKAKWADTRTELAKGIKADIELGNFENQMDSMRSNFNSLSDANDKLRNSFDATEDAYKAMVNASKANSGDEVADRERLIQAEKEYAAALEKTNNLIKQQARRDSVSEANERLANSHKALELDMVNWLKNNSRATKEYEDKIYDLIGALNKLEQAGNLKQIDVNSTRSQFNLLTKDAERRGLTGLTVWDKLLSKAKEYASYLSAAEVFMYVEQAFSSMFEQVKLIDSAMTELKKVTDETDASYNNFLSDASSRAKEIGTTIDGLVSSTADFARLGYSMSEATELAEVANIYSVVGDDIESVETATESLISTMTAFGVEASNSMSIVDKFNAVGKLIA